MAIARSTGPPPRHHLVEFAGALPFRCGCRAEQTKYLLRRVIRGKVPPESFTRPKQGLRGAAGSLASASGCPSSFTTCSEKRAVWPRRHPRVSGSIADGSLQHGNEGRTTADACGPWRSWTGRFTASDAGAHSPRAEMVNAKRVRSRSVHVGLLRLMQACPTPTTRDSHVSPLLGDGEGDPRALPIGLFAQYMRYLFRPLSGGVRSDLVHQLKRGRVRRIRPR